MNNQNNKRLIFCFGKRKANSRWYRIILDKTPTALPIIVFFGSVSILPLPFKNIYELIIFKLFFLMLFILSVLTYSNTVIEVQIDEEYLYVRKYRKFIKISWNDIKHMKVFRLVFSGAPILWIKTKKGWRGYLCVVGASSHENKYKIFSNLLFEIKKRIGEKLSFWLLILIVPVKIKDWSQDSTAC